MPIEQNGILEPYEVKVSRTVLTGVKIGDYWIYPTHKIMQIRMNKYIIWPVLHVSVIKKKFFLFFSNT